MAVEQVERLLWERYRFEDDQEARDCLYLLYAPWAKAIARSIFCRIRLPQMEFSDYVQNASIGLLEAMSRYEVSRGIEFRLYGKPRVRGAVFNGLRIFLSEPKASTRPEDLSERLSSLHEGLTRDPFDSVVDSIVGLGIGYMLDVASDSEFVCQSMDGLAYAQTRQFEAMLLLAVESLPERLQLIVSAHYFQHVPFHEIATHLGLTKGRVSQLHKSAMGRIREQLQAGGLVGADI
jgi:RNA polymerase sigma factor for flagellar operon FliA